MTVPDGKKDLQFGDIYSKVYHFSLLFVYAK